MAPSKRNQKTQLSMLNFTKRNAIEPDTATQPRANEHPQRALRRMPRPTAPPFFEQPMPKPPLARHATTVADDAWEAASRLMNGQRLTPKKRAFEDNAPAVDDSDDDFESEAAMRRARAQSSSKTQRSSPALRNDRASMTKRSANKSKRAEPLGYIPTQQRSVFEEHGVPPKMLPLCSSEDDDDDNHVVVFDGEKSSLSGTDNEDERGVDEIDLDSDLVEPRPSDKSKGIESAHHREKEPQNDAECGDVHNADEVDIDARVSRALQSRVKLSSPERQRKPLREKPPFVGEGSGSPHSFRNQAPKTVGLQKCSVGSQDLLKAPLVEQTEHRRTKIRPLFNSDTDESDSEKYICRERRRRGRLKSPPLHSPSSGDSLEDEDPGRPSKKATTRSVIEDNEMEDSEKSRLRDSSQGSESSDVEIVCTPKQRQQNAERNFDSSQLGRNRINTLGDRELDGRNSLGTTSETTLRTPRNRKSNSREANERQKSISEYLATASPSLSPPSNMKKRRRFRRLIVAQSSEDEDDVNVTAQGSDVRNRLGKLRQNSDGTAQELSPETPKSAEWYHERDIDEFSESSCDLRPTPRRSYVTRAVTRRKRRIARGSHGGRPLLPVKRNISKSFDQSPDENKTIETPSTHPSAPHVQSSGVRHSRDSAKRDHTETRRNVDTEVIDLVDEEEPGEASIFNSLSSGRGEKIDSPAFEDDAPPPFNLIALCKDGESIREMKERLGEEFVMDKVTEAQENGREIVGGEELGLIESYNKGVFDRFSKTIVADQLGKVRAAKSMTEKAFRGEYKFHYRGRQKDSTADQRRGATWRGNRSRGRFANYRRKRGTS